MVLSSHLALGIVMALFEVFSAQHLADTDFGGAGVAHNPEMEPVRRQVELADYLTEI